LKTGEGSDFGFFWWSQLNNFFVEELYHRTMARALQPYDTKGQWIEKENQLTMGA
jgi:hypothetical protein